MDINGDGDQSRTAVTDAWCRTAMPEATRDG